MVVNATPRLKGDDETGIVVIFYVNIEGIL